MDSYLIRPRNQANLVLEQSAAFNLHFYIKEFVFWPKYNLYARVETNEGLEFFSSLFATEEKCNRLLTTIWRYVALRER